MPAFTEKSKREFAKPIAESLQHSATVIETDPTPKQDQVVDPNYRGSNVNTNLEQVNSLLVHIEGSSWSVDYYSQLLGMDDELSEQQLGQSAVYQQYHLVNHLELKLSGSLTYSEDNETKDMSVTGNAILYPFIVPNAGDMLVGDVGDGRSGVFTITNTNRMTLLKETCYEIEFKLVAYLDDTRREDLKRKTVKVSHYRKELLAHGQNPILVESEVNTLEALKAEFRQLANVYIHDFTDHEHRTLVLPDQFQACYDPQVVTTIKQIVSPADCSLITDTVVMNCQDGGTLSEPSIWTMALMCDKALLRVLNPQSWMIPSSTFSQNTYMNSIAWSNISYVMYPRGRDTGFRSAINYVDSIVGILPEPSESTLVDLPVDARLLREQYKLPALTDSQVVFKPTINDEGTYVLSDAFYNDAREGMSVLEQRVMDMVERKAIPPIEVLWLARASIHLGALERYYYTPLLLIMIKYCLSRV